MRMHKARKVGNSISITLPQELGIPAGTEFLVNQLPDGTIALVPAEKVREHLIRETLGISAGDPVPQHPDLSLEFLAWVKRDVEGHDGLYRALADL